MLGIPLAPTLFTKAIPLSLCRRLLSHGVGFEFRSDEPPRSPQHAAADEISHILDTNPWGRDTVQSLEKCNVLFDTHIISKVLRRTKSTVKATGLFEWLKANDFRHDHRTYGALINMFGEAGRIDKMEQVIKEMHKSGNRMGRNLYGNVIFWYACAGDTKRAIKCWKEMKQQRLLPGRSACATMMDVFSTEKRYKNVASLFLEMINYGHYPSSRTYAILIRDLLDAGKLVAAYLIFRKLPTVGAAPQMQTFAYLMFVFAKEGNIKKVKKLGTAMRSLYDRPGRMFCNAVQYLRREGKMKEAEILSEQVWPELDVNERVARVLKVGNFLKTPGHQEQSKSVSEEERLIFSDVNLPEDDASEHELLKFARGLKSWGTSECTILEQIKVWNADMVNMMLRHIKSVDVAWSFFLWVKPRVGSRHDVYSQLTMLRILAQNGCFHALEELLTEMEKERVKLSIITFNVIMKECALAKNSKAAVRVLSLIKKFKHLKPNGETFTSLIIALARDSRHDQAFKLWERLQDKGFRHSTDMYTLLIHSLGSAGQIDRANMVFERMLSSRCTPDVYTYTALLQAHGLANNTNEALQLYRKMRDARIAPIAATHVVMAKVLRQIGNLEEALKLGIEANCFSSSCNTEALMLIHKIICDNIE